MPGSPRLPPHLRKIEAVKQYPPAETEPEPGPGMRCHRSHDGRRTGEPGAPGREERCEGDEHVGHDEEEEPFREAPGETDHGRSERRDQTARGFPKGHRAWR